MHRAASTPLPRPLIQLPHDNCLTFARSKCKRAGSQLPLLWNQARVSFRFISLTGIILTLYIVPANVTQVVHQLAHVSDLLSHLSGNLWNASDRLLPINVHINVHLNGMGKFRFLVLLSSPDSAAAATQPLAIWTRELGELGKFPLR